MKNLGRVIVSSCLLPVLAACGSSGESSQNKAQVSSSAQSSSSVSSEVKSLSVDYIYPGNYSHTGEALNTSIVIRTPQTLDRVYSGNTEFIEVSDNIWRATLVNLEPSKAQQVIELKGELGESEFEFQPLIVSNDLSLDAGQGNNANSTDALVFSTDGSAVYFTESQHGRVSELNLKSAQVATLYQSDRDVKALNSYWPLALNTQAQSLSIIEHESAYSDELFNTDLGANLTQIDLSTNTVSSLVLSAPKVNVNALVIDSQGLYPFSEGDSLAYVVDDEAEVGFTYITLADDEVITGDLNTTYEPDLEFAVDNQRKDIVLSDDGQTLYTLINNPQPTVLKLTASVSATGNTRTLLQTEMLLKYMDLAVKSAGAFTVSPLNSSVIYITGERKIWRANMETGLLEVISASVPGNSARGVGPDFTTHLSDIQHHPAAQVLYISLGSFGMMAVDIESGDRSIVIN